MVEQRTTQRGVSSPSLYSATSDPYPINYWHEGLSPIPTLEEKCPSVCCTFKKFDSFHFHQLVNQSTCFLGFCFPPWIWNKMVKYQDSSSTCDIILRRLIDPAAHVRPCYDWRCLFLSIFNRSIPPIQHFRLSFNWILVNTSPRFFRVRPEKFSWRDASCTKSQKPELKGSVKL